MAEPSLLVLDEPTTGLDPHSRREVWALLESLRGRGTTILITTHYMEEAEAICDRVAIIARGSIRAEGTVEELRSLCRNRYKATFGEENGVKRRTVYGSTLEEVAVELARLDIHEYAIGKTTLEDLYLELTSQHLEEGQYA
jgi:ABC-2 type transport system ATP-binding protein